MAPVYKLEIPIFGPSAGPSALKAGVKQIELNRDGSYHVGGLTPSFSELQTLISSFPSESKRPTIRIMIRPRGPPLITPDSRDFIYSTLEYEVMKSCIGKFVKSGLLDPEKGDGFVLGLLKKSSSPSSSEAEGSSSSSSSIQIDYERVKELVGEAKGLKVVFHRAFDEFLSSRTTKEEQEEGMRKLKEVGVAGILTSGGKGNAVNNIGCLKRLVMCDEGERPELIVGGGVRSRNLKEMIEGIGADKMGVLFHSSCLREGSFDEEEAGELGRVLDELGVERVEG
ncbi:copper homeostasis CutC domain-containing protein [Podospora fimiseda]|uniref:Copper homeostasis protein cutC homolog n=1 Tax=Podospora fimiseda TaxID=252190 RepID=A0AAN7BLP1_9PEZI|nr:copper homeostasis CutC domain-containing protein [Podospora fimiseda]